MLKDISELSNHGSDPDLFRRRQNRHRLSLGVGKQQSNRRRREARPQLVRTTCQNDRNTRSKHDCCANSSRHERQLFDQHISGLNVGNEQNVCSAGHWRYDMLLLGGLSAYGGVKCKGAVDTSARNLPPIGHLAQRSCFHRRGNLLGDVFDR